MKKLTVGILAHVDAGKTTLSEHLLYLSGCIRTPGRVDHKNTFLDTDAMERSRGITIFSKQAVLTTPDMTVYLMDTPGHTDFSAEMERVLSVLDYAILVISATDGVQIHTRTVWRLLSHHKIPTFLFINKMDLAGAADREALLSALTEKLSEGCVDFGLLAANKGAFYEDAAMHGEALMTEYLETGALTDRSLSLSVRERILFPCYFGSALKGEGVAALLSGLSRYTVEPERGETFGARVYKVGRDPSGVRLTYLHITGGTLRVKTPLTGKRTVGGHGASEDTWQEKVDGIRIYSGEKYKAVDAVSRGDVCAVTGLTSAMPGDGLGVEENIPGPTLTPVLSYRLCLPPDCNENEMYLRLQQLGEEDPTLHLTRDRDLGEIRVSLMGEMQMEILTHRIKERFGIDVTFDMGNILYYETVGEPIACAGHFEPLRHYAEVHLLIEPGEVGGGVTFDSVCPENTLARNWQRLILSQLEEMLPPGTLIGAPLTDLRITLTGGRAHVKHTEGGDFLEAARRALRQGLMKAREAGSARLLEPWYDFRITLPDASAGRAIGDIQRMTGTVQPPEMGDEPGQTVLVGCAPASAMRSYPEELISYTRGRGRIALSFHGYAPCHETETVTAEMGYDPDRDTRHPADSVFCSGGAGVRVPWQEADGHMHTESVLARRDAKGIGTGTAFPGAAGGGPRSRRGPVTYADRMEEDRELRSIFERTYGPLSKKTVFIPPPPPVTEVAPGLDNYLSMTDPEEEYVLVDGYNMIFSWEELKLLARDSLDLARQTLIHILANYQGYKKCNLILVFDAYKVSDGRGSVERHGGIYVIYTRTAETADSYIERVTYDIGRHRRVRVATSDAMEQIIVLGHGAQRLSAAGFYAEVAGVREEISAFIAESNAKNR